MSARRLLMLVLSSGLLLSARVAAADMDVVIDGSRSEWNAEPSYLDPNGDAPNAHNNIRDVWLADNNSSGSDGYLFIGIRFQGNIRSPQQSNHLEDVWMSIDTDMDGNIDFIVRADRDTSTYEMIGLGGNPSFTYVYGTDYRDLNADFVEMRIPYADLGLTYGSDRFLVRVAADNLADYAPNDGSLYYDGPVADAVDGTIAPTAAEVGAASARWSRRGVEIVWQVGAELDNAGFEVVRLDPYRGTWSLVGRRAGRGTSAIAASYGVGDPRGRVGDLYAVIDVDLRGVATQHPAVIALPALIVPSRAIGDRFRASRPAVAHRAGDGGGTRIGHPIGSLADGVDVKISVTDGGLVRVARADLLAAGVSWAPPPKPNVTFFGAQVPAWWAPDGDLLFHARPVDAPTRALDVYVLRAAGTGHSPTRAVQPPTRQELARAPSWSLEVRHVEEQGVYAPAAPDDDPFTMTYVTSDLPAAVPVDLPGLSPLAPASTELAVVVRLRGTWDWAAADPDHHAIARVGDVTIGEVWFDGTDTAELHATVEAGALAAAGSIAIQAPGDSGIPWECFELDEIEVVYPRARSLAAGPLGAWGRAGEAVRIRDVPAGDVFVLDVTNVDAPVLLHGGVRADGELRFVERAAASPRRPPDRRSRIGAPRADFVGDRPWSRPSIGAARRYLVVSAGTEVAPVSVEPVGARASDLLDAVAGADYVVLTHAALRDAAEELAAWRIGRGLDARVVDVEDVHDAFAGGNHGSESIQAFLGELAVSPLPPSFVVLFGAASVDPRNYLGASGPDFVPSPPMRELGHDLRAWSDELYATGAGGAPAFAIGRVPARSLDEALAYVAKVADYETAVLTEGMAGSSLLVADIPSTGDIVFDRALDQLADSVAVGSPATRVSVAEVGVAAARTELLAGFGEADVIVWAGHGNPLWWSRHQIFTIDDTPSLTPGRAAFVLSTACYDGWHTHPDHAPLGWALVSGPPDPRAGAVGVLGSTTLSHPAVSAGFNEAVVGEVYLRGARTWGEAARRARTNLVGVDPQVQSALDAIAFLGDPALAVPTPPPESDY